MQKVRREIESFAQKWRNSLLTFWTNVRKVLVTHFIQHHLQLTEKKEEQQF